MKNIKISNYWLRSYYDARLVHSSVHNVMKCTIKAHLPSQPMTHEQTQNFSYKNQHISKENCKSTQVSHQSSKHSKGSNKCELFDPIPVYSFLFLREYVVSPSDTSSLQRSLAPFDAIFFKFWKQNAISEWFMIPTQELLQ